MEKLLKQWLSHLEHMPSATFNNSIPDKQSQFQDTRFETPIIQPSPLQNHFSSQIQVAPVQQVSAYHHPLQNLLTDNSSSPTMTSAILYDKILLQREYYLAELNNLTSLQAQMLRQQPSVYAQYLSQAPNLNALQGTHGTSSFLHEGPSYDSRIIPTSETLKPEPVFTVCPPTSQRLKGKLYVVRGSVKRWDGKRFAKCCAVKVCTKLAQGPTNFCKSHGGGSKYRDCNSTTSSSDGERREDRKRPHEAMQQPRTDSLSELDEPDDIVPDLHPEITDVHVLKVGKENEPMSAGV